MPNELYLPNIPPRWYQQPMFQAFFRGIKNFVISWPRRHGKDLCTSQLLLLGAMSRVDNYWYLYPSRAHADRVIWKKAGTMMIHGEERTGRVIDFLFPPELVEKKKGEGFIY